MYQTSTTLVKVGRPIQTQEHKVIIDKLYQSNYYATVTKNNRVVKSLDKKYSTDLKDNNENYKNGIINKFSTYDYNYFFTATNNPNYLQSQTIELYNKNVQDFNKEFDGKIKSASIYKKVTASGLRKQAESFVNFLLSINAISKAIIFFESSTSNNWHTHILLNFINKKVDYVNYYLENKWLNGISLCLPIPDKEDTKRIISYCTKEINLDSKKKADKDKVLFWNILGIYESQPKTKIKVLDNKFRLGNKQIRQSA